MWRTTSLPRTSASTRTHWSPWKVGEVELMQCVVTSLPSMTIFVPGVQTFAVGRGSLPLPPSNWTSMEMGKFWSLPIVSGGWQWIMMPLLR